MIKSWWKTLYLSRKGHKVKAPECFLRVCTGKSCRMTWWKHWFSWFYILQMSSFEWKVLSGTSSRCQCSSEWFNMFNINYTNRLCWRREEATISWVSQKHREAKQLPDWLADVHDFSVVVAMVPAALVQYVSCFIWRARGVFPSLWMLSSGRQLPDFPSAAPRRWQVCVQLPDKRWHVGTKGQRGMAWRAQTCIITLLLLGKRENNSKGSRKSEKMEGIEHWRTRQSKWTCKDQFGKTLQWCFHKSLWCSGCVCHHCELNQCGRTCLTWWWRQKHPMS